MMHPKKPGMPTGMKVSPKDMTSAKAKFAKMKENSPKKVTITAESMSPREMKKVNKSMKVTKKDILIAKGVISKKPTKK